MRRTSLQQTTDLMLDAAASDLQRLAGGAAVCTFTRSGRAVPGIKYAEGRWAALREVQRSLRDDEAGQIARERLEVWQAKLDDGLARQAGTDWTAYWTGGVDVLVDLLGTDDGGEGEQHDQ